MPDTRVFPIGCKSLMTRSGIPSLDYAINPYLGCAHGCVYCYASFMARFRDIKDPWGSFVGYKERAPEVIRRELRRRQPGVVTFGTVCDAYQPIEKELRLTRSCLESFIGVEGFDVGMEMSGSPAAFRDMLANMCHGGKIALLGLVPPTEIDWGEVVFNGPPSSMLEDEDSLTGAYLSGRLKLPVPRDRRDTDNGQLEVKGARQHNLKGFNNQFKTQL